MALVTGNQAERQVTADGEVSLTNPVKCGIIKRKGG